MSLKVTRGMPRLVGGYAYVAQERHVAVWGWSSGRHVLMWHGDFGPEEGGFTPFLQWFWLGGKMV